MTPMTTTASPAPVNHIAERNASYGIRSAAAKRLGLADAQYGKVYTSDLHNANVGLRSVRALSLHDGDFETNTRTEYPAGTFFTLRSTSNAGTNGITAAVVAPDGSTRYGVSLGAFRLA